MNVLTMDAVVVAAQDVVSCDLAGDTAILHLGSGTYFTLNAVATTVWHALQEPARVADLCELILERYDVDADACAADLDALLRDLLAQNLIAFHP